MSCVKFVTSTYLVLKRFTQDNCNYQFRLHRLGLIHFVIVTYEGLSRLCYDTTTCAVIENSAYTGSFGSSVMCVATSVPEHIFKSKSMAAKFR